MIAVELVRIETEQAAGDCEVETAAGDSRLFNLERDRKKKSLRAGNLPGPTGGGRRSGSRG